MPENRKLDCNGLVCPMPVAKTKRVMNEMESGDILEVSGDFGEAGENIRRFVENNGLKVIEAKIEAKKYYLKIQKL
jgi:tRNA 2-thiouridine synthesizing protein A